MEPGGPRTEERRGDVARAGRGDVQAFARLMTAYSGLVRATALRVLGARDAQDASQEVWIRVWRNIKGFRGDSAFTTWLYRITMNTCLSVRHKESRRDERHHAGEETRTPASPAPATLPVLLKLE
jgi:RNA polymerase sigma factor (sigma-70 family)